MYHGTITRNDDGTHTSSLGHEVSVGPGGSLWVGGAPTGLKDNGFGSIGSSYGRSAAAGGSAASGKGTAAAGTWPAGPGGGAAIGSLFHRATVIYPWLLAVAMFAYQLVSSAQVFGRPTLHAHPVFGVAAFLFTVWAYRTLMTRLPTAIPLAIVSSVAFAALVVANADPKAGRFLQILWRSVGKTTLSADRWAMLVQPVFIAFFLGAFAIGLLLHFLYWQHRVQMARSDGWLLSDSLLDNLKIAFSLVLLAGISGGVMSAFR